MNPVKKQAMLKLALFAALAANLSYGPIKTHMKSNSIELMAVVAYADMTPDQKRAADAQREALVRQEAARVAALARTASAAATTTTTTAAIVVPPLTTTTAAAPAPVPVAAVTAVVAAPVPEVQMSNDRIRLCQGTAAEREQRINFRHADGYTYIEPTESDCRDCYVRIQQADSAALRTQTLIPSLRDELEKIACAVTPTQTAEEREAALKEKKRNERRVARCEVKKVVKAGEVEYVELEKKSEERYECNLERIAKVDEELEKELGRKPTKAQIQARIDEIVSKELKGRVNELLTSRDEDEREDGRELARDLKEELQEAGEDFSLRGMDKLVKRIHGFELGSGYLADLYKQEESMGDMSDVARDLKLRIAQAQASGQRDFSAETQMTSLGQQMRYADITLGQSLFTPFMRLQNVLGDDFSSYSTPFDQFHTTFNNTWHFNQVTGLMEFNDTGSVFGAGTAGTVVPGLNPHRGAGSVLYTSRGIAGLPTTAPNLGDLRSGGESRFSTNSVLSGGLSSNNPSLGRLRVN